MALEDQTLEDDLLPPPPKKGLKTSKKQDLGDDGLLPPPPLKKYTLRYYWHKTINWLKTNW